ncbi:hypothetical protein QA596_11630 [Balneolales bacterium ANBcel1]|nr:hypothetical protein [Balneolales bacterium ANBcel1]
MEQAILESGHSPIRIGSPRNLLINPPDADLIWNIGEGYGTRNREAWAPVLCEMHGIPCIGSDAYTLTATLDKALTKQWARNLGIPTADWQIIRRDTYLRESIIPPPELPYPLFLKPRYEGTAKGITGESIIRDDDTFLARSRYLLETYDQDVLAEPFLPGAELTCAVAFHPLRPLPVMERGLHSSGIGSHAVPEENPLHTLTSDALTPERENDIAGWSLRLSRELPIRDFARFDFKLDESGRPMFLEVNPLPTFGVDSTFAILAEMEGVPYPVYLSNILTDAIRRLREEHSPSKM